MTEKDLSTSVAVSGALPERALLQSMTVGENVALPILEHASSTPGSSISW